MWLFYSLPLLLWLQHIREDRMEIALIVSLVVLAFLGLINSSYLAYKRKTEQPLVCPINHNCNVVIESKWSKVFYIKNDTLGVMYYAVLFILGLFLFSNIYTNLIINGLLLINTLAFLFSVFLLYVQKYKLKSYCFYCLISALITSLVFLNTLILYDWTFLV